MVFSSVVFLFYFLPLVLMVYHFANNKFRNYTLLTFSLVFYAWGEPIFVIVMITVIVVDYLAGIVVYKTSAKKAKKIWLVTCLIMNVGILVYYKYYNFIIDSINSIIVKLGISIPTINVDSIALPIGISFFIFQGLSYVVDVYQGKCEAQKNPFKIALYVSLFPQLIAGPIVR